MSSLRAAVDELAAEDVHELAASVLAADLVELNTQIARLQADRTRRLAAFDATRSWEADGSLSCAAWLRAKCRIAPGAAAEQVRVARRLRQLPETEAAFSDGAIGYDHVRTVVHAVADIPAEKVAEAEPLLVEAARKLDPKNLGKACAHWRHAVEPDVFLADANAAYAQRRLHLSETFRGMGFVDGRYDSEGFATIATAVTPSRRRRPVIVVLPRNVAPMPSSRSAGGPWTPARCRPAVVRSHT